MKNNRIMRGIGLFLLGILCYGSLMAQSFETAGRDKEVTDFFSMVLSGKEMSFDKGKKINLKEVEKAKLKVWSLWKLANENCKEEKLPQLSDLTEKDSCSWTLPEVLEPNAVMNYYFGRKGEQKEGVKIPFFLYMHGSGPKAIEWKTGLNICQRFDDAPSVYFISQIPNMGSYYRWWQKAKQYAWNRLFRQVLLNELIDPNRLYLFGISEGGYGSQRLASFYADYLAAAGPMAGGEPLKNAPAENCANIGFSLLTGAEDEGFYRNILTGYTKQSFDSLHQVYPEYYQHRIELIPHRGHFINYSLTTPWLKKFVRNPYPKWVSWEDFEMDGLHRKGFYNLVVTERPEHGRMHYDMKIEGNTITVNVRNVKYRTIQTDSVYGIEMKFEKDYTQAVEGRFMVYLNNNLVDLKKKVKLVVNGKKVYEGKVKPDLKHLVNSCAVFYDPLRLYPVALTVDLSVL